MAVEGLGQILVAHVVIRRRAADAAVPAQLRRTLPSTIALLLCVAMSLVTTTQSAYDGDGRLITQQDALGGQTTYGYDPLGATVAVTDAAGHTTRSAYDADGRLLTATDALGHQTVYGYDALGETVAVTDPLWVDRDPALRGAGWLAARRMHRGDALRTASGRDVTIVRLRRHVGRAVVYTLTVAKDHTFFVGSARVLVHNSEEPCPGIGDTWDGPGAWGPGKNNRGGASAEYQHQITGVNDLDYWVNNIAFDGYDRTRKVLLEAKDHYAWIFNDRKGTLATNFLGDTLKQMERQVEAAPEAIIEWHFAEKEIAHFVKNRLASSLSARGPLGHVRVVYTPHVQLLCTPHTFTYEECEMDEGETHIMSVQWGKQPDGSAACAARTTDCLRRLGRRDVLLSRWWYTPPVDWDAARGPEDVDLTSTEITLDEPKLLDYLLAGRSYTDREVRVIEELGVHLRLDNDMWDDHDRLVTFDVACGRFGNQPNRCELDHLSLRPVEGSTLREVGTLKAILGDLIDVWDPDWGYVDSHVAMAEGSEPSADVNTPVWPGWWTYVSARYAVVAEPPPVGTAEAFKSGVLYSVTDGLFTIENSDHTQARHAMRIWLRHVLA